MPYPTSKELWDARLDPDYEEHLYQVERIALPRAIGADAREMRLPAEMVTWQNGALDWMGLIIDPELEDVPIEGRGWFRFSCKWHLKRVWRAAHDFGESVASEIYFEPST